MGALRISSHIELRYLCLWALIYERPLNTVGVIPKSPLEMKIPNYEEAAPSPSRLDKPSNGVGPRQLVGCKAKIIQFRLNADISERFILLALKASEGLKITQSRHVLTRALLITFDRAEFYAIAMQLVCEMSLDISP